MTESPYTQKGTQGDLAPGGEPVALSALIEHGVRLEWHEAVAVVRDICELLHEADPPAPVPDLRHIWICANGRMAIAPGTTGGAASAEQPVTTLGRLLLSLVEEVRMPVQLRLVALSAAETIPAFATVDEFSNALAYFERPGGAPPIRPAYSRWHALIAERDAPAAPQPPPSTLPPPIPLPPTLPPEASLAPTLPSETSPVPAPPPPTSLPPTPERVVDLTATPDALGLFLPEERVVTSRGRPFRVFPIAAAAVVILTVTLILVWSFSSPSLPSPGAAEPAQAPTEETSAETVTWSSPLAEDVDLDAAGRAARRGSGAAARRNRLGPAPVAAAPTRPDKAAVSPATPSPRQGDTRAVSPAVQPALKVSPPAVAPPGVAPRAAAPVSTSTAVGSVRQPTVDERLPVPVGEPPDGIYSSADKDVEPPILVRPRVSVDPPAGGQLEGMTVLDLLISQTGQVETIKLASPARDFREAMTISAIKTWKFRPGMRDGHPVRYQKRIWIRISPIGTLVR